MISGSEDWSSTEVGTVSLSDGSVSVTVGSVAESVGFTVVAVADSEEEVSVSLSGFLLQAQKGTAIEAASIAAMIFPAFICASVIEKLREIFTK